VGAEVIPDCHGIVGIPIACHAKLPDGSDVRIRVTSAAGAWEWQLEDRIDTAAVQAYVDGVLGDLGLAQTARCPPLSRERRIACALSGGGVAFVDVAASGQLSLELALDAAAATARSVPTPQRDLVRMSRALQRLDDEDDEPPEDGGIAQP